LELNNPTPDFVKYFAKQVYPTSITSKVLEQFTNLTKKSFQQYINDVINERLKSALTKEEEKVKEEEKLQNQQQIEDASKTETTAEELDGFMIVKTILRQSIKIDRISYRDAQSYFAIMLDDNNRKSVCRLYLNGGKKFIGTFDEQKKEIKNEIVTIGDIFNYSEVLLNTATGFDKK
jgi:hypothetical protein